MREFFSAVTVLILFLTVSSCSYKSQLNSSLDTSALVDNDGIQSSLSNNLENGKLTYIKFWGTWCGNCIAEMPEYNLLVDRFQGEDIKFISIAIDSPQSDWETTIEKEELAGEKFISFDQNLADIIEESGYPFYILLDKEGKIIGHNITHPSEKIAIDYVLLSATKHNQKPKKSLKDINKGRLVINESDSKRIYDYAIEESLKLKKSN